MAKLNSPCRKAASMQCCLKVLQKEFKQHDRKSDIPSGTRYSLLEHIAVGNSSMSFRPKQTLHKVPSNSDVVGFQKTPAWCLYLTVSRRLEVKAQFF